ncbi:unnamed protein product [Gulo gulo]|uniref:Uncharacterized protein n=1 Tax=Gulo gulo TaxID=48420 RepID=A0A9X9M3E2_GULGU|nr:unnamed protein product [Gulo gulo]
MLSSGGCSFRTFTGITGEEERRLPGYIGCYCLLPLSGRC